MGMLRRVFDRVQQTISKLDIMTQQYEECSAMAEALKQDMQLADSRLEEANAEQARMETELSTAYTDSDKYRQQATELERQMKEADRRSKDEVGLAFFTLCNIYSSRSA